MKIDYRRLKVAIRRTFRKLLNNLKERGGLDDVVTVIEVVRV